MNYATRWVVRLAKTISSDGKLTSPRGPFIFTFWSENRVPKRRRKLNWENLSASSFERPRLSPKEVTLVALVTNPGARVTVQARFF